MLKKVIIAFTVISIAACTAQAESLPVGSPLPSINAADQNDPNPISGSEDRPISVTPELFSTPGDAAISLDESRKTAPPSNPPDTPATVAAAFTATAEAEPRAMEENPPNIPATVAAAFTATAVSELESVIVEPAPYVPSLSDYLEILGSKFVDGTGLERTRLIDNFNAVAAIYYMNSAEFGIGQPTKDAFKSLVSYMYNFMGYYDSYLHESIGQMYARWLRSAASKEGDPGGNRAFLNDPSRDQAMLLCLIADKGTAGLDIYYKSRRPPEPACETAFAVYSAFHMDDDLGYLSYLNGIFPAWGYSED